MDHHNRRAFGVARPEVEDVQCCTFNLDHAALRRMEALQRKDSRLRDQRQQRERGHDEDGYHIEGPDGPGHPRGTVLLPPGFESQKAVIPHDGTHRHISIIVSFI